MPVPTTRVIKKYKGELAFIRLLNAVYYHRDALTPGNPDLQLCITLPTRAHESWSRGCAPRQAYGFFGLRRVECRPAATIDLCLVTEPFEHIIVRHGSVGAHEPRAAGARREDCVSHVITIRGIQLSVLVREGEEQSR